jgi:magnesium chelatase family protein
VPARHNGGADLRDVRGQHGARRALEIAAAGGHNLLFLGPPGSGKTLLAQRLPGILPPLDPAEALEVTKIHSAASEPIENGLVSRRPFRSPHPGTSVAGMVGGGPFARPGEVSLSHAGVLFLDELPEFHRDALEALRQPLEDGSVSIVRARARWIYPARFSLIAAMNPCPCGHLGDPRHDCRCPLPLVERYRSRVSGPLLDRIDMHVEVPAVSLADLRSRGGCETSAAVASRVQEARERQRRRGFPGSACGLNALLQGRALAEHCAIDAAGQALLDAAFERLGLSARAMTRVLRLARTIADLAASDSVRSVHLAEAIQYRALDRRLGSPSRHAVSA